MLDNMVKILIFYSFCKITLVKNGLEVLPI